MAVPHGERIRRIGLGDRKLWNRQTSEVRESPYHVVQFRLPSTTCDVSPDRAQNSVASAAIAGGETGPDCNQRKDPKPSVGGPVGHKDSDTDNDRSVGRYQQDSRDRHANGEPCIAADPPGASLSA